MVKNAPKGKPFLTDNDITVRGGNFSKLEREALVDRLFNQLDDSSTVTTRRTWIFFNQILRPPVYDSGYSAVSASNMKASMFHLGYYDAIVNFSADTSGQKVRVKYSIDAGNPTLIDTVNYGLRDTSIQALVLESRHQSILQKGNPITKAAVTGEMARLVDTLRNNGYYKFTAAELRVRGDTTIEALTTVSDDPVEQLRLLAEAQMNEDSPKIRLAVVLNPPADSSRLSKYFIRQLYIYPDYLENRARGDSGLTEVRRRNAVIRYRDYLFKPSFLSRNVTFSPGDVFRQDQYFNTLNNFSRAGVWQSTNLKISEIPGTDSVDLFAELIPGKKYGFEASLEASYSATSNTNSALAGNLFGLSANFSILNRNFRKEAIRMSHNFRAGVELNNSGRANKTRLINSNEVSYSNSVVIPRLITPSAKFNRRQYSLAESFINTSVGFNNRLALFNLNTVNVNHGYTFIDRHSRKWTLRPFNLEFNYLFNQTDSFRNILNENPFLRYSYNTALILGTSAGMSHVYRNPRHLRSLSRERSWKFNIEESGLTWGALPILTKYKRKYIRADVEYKYLVTYPKTALAFRLFTGIGYAFGGDTTLPFFKQYFGGGSNSMRAWPVRGVGRGSQPLAPYGRNIFNDRTADMQIEGNVEYRYDILRMFGNTLTLRGAVFSDVGNIWNIRNTRPDGLPDSTLFKFRNLYKEIGVAAGTGFRLDFNYFILRFDFAFRIKRPEMSHINNGWKLPDIGFDDAFRKIFSSSDAARRWRYENFNFTIGISYPF